MKLIKIDSVQKLGLFILILIISVYIYLPFFKNQIKTPEEYSPLETITEQNTGLNEQNEGTATPTIKPVQIFILDKTGKIRPVNRDCDIAKEKFCFEYAIKELIKAPTKWEKSKGFTSEIPQNTKILSIRGSSNSILIDLSSDFEAGGGAESSYLRIKQLIKTANANTNIPVYLYINGREVNVIGGEGIMIKQPLTERSLDE